MTTLQHCDCGDPCTEIICAECGRAQCLACYSRYEVPLPGIAPRLCWQCQNEADLEWLQNDLREPRRTGPRREAA